MKKYNLLLVKIILASLLALPVLAKENSATKFGAAIAASEAVNFDQILKNAKENLTKTVVATGKVSKVCVAKGCWMEVSGEKESARVTFKNYGFFVPKDILDKKIKIQGQLTEKTMSVKEQKHYLEDEGRTKAEIAAIKEPKFVYEFIADGVEIVN